VSVTQLALEHGFNTDMVFKWRRELRAGLLDRLTTLLPVSMAPFLPLVQPKSTVNGVIEIGSAPRWYGSKACPIPQHLALSCRVWGTDWPACWDSRLACRRRHRHALRLQRPGAKMETALAEDPFSGHVFVFGGRVAT
jgi:hypothetical protein